jgi:hypothetical protein
MDRWIKRRRLYHRREERPGTAAAEGDRFAEIKRRKRYSEATAGRMTTVRHLKKNTGF